MTQQHIIKPTKTETDGEKPLELRVIKGGKGDYRPFSLEDFKAEYGGTDEEYILKDEDGWKPPHLKYPPNHTTKFDVQEKYSANDVLNFIKQQGFEEPNMYSPCYPMTDPNKKHIGHLTVRYETEKTTHNIHFQNIDLSNYKSPYKR